ncbi:MAG: UvrD-helicase domain-containing protein [Trueperaceae bacterium]|nr:UvrD-helicase domain-containing protein [Trueperaceae bacterium]
MRVRVASAGTGKTTSLVLRYLELVDAAVPLNRIAGVTFTRAAAGELRQRVAAGLAEVLDEGAYLGGLFTPTAGAAVFERARAELGGAVVSTIHGFMIEALRLNAPSLGLDPGFGLLGEWEAAAIFEEECAGILMLAQDEAHPLHAAAAALGAAAMELLTRLFGKRSLAPELTFGATEREAALARLYRAALVAYDARLGATSLAPGEVERRAITLLEREPARLRLVERFPRVLVDEYQDVNPLQGEFFERLAAAGAKLELVGDPKQSIYGFRNADVAVFRRALAAAEAHGEVQQPLRESRRHAQAPVAFLNRLTTALARREQGFTEREAPAVAAAGGQARVLGSVELIVVEGEAPLDRLRDREAELLAERLLRHHAAGIAFEEMAVIARGHTALARVAVALRAKGVPGVILQGRGYYERSEIRDVYHALSVGIDPEGSGLLPFLRGPFAGLELHELADVARSEPRERLPRIGERWPAVARRIERMTELARATPLVAVTGLLREPILDGRRFQEYLPRRGRENVDALLFEVAGQAPRDVALFLDRLDLLARLGDAGDVPQSGGGVRLLTIHASKGLEFRLAAVFDTGAWRGDRGEPLLVEPGAGAVRLAGEPGFEEAQAAAARRAEQEGYRLLYVAASRSRDVLVLTGSQARRPGPWLAALLDLGLEAAGAVEGVRVERHPYSPGPEAGGEIAVSTVADAVEGAAEPAAWLSERYPRPWLPPVMSPTALARLRGGPDQAGVGAAGRVPGDESDGLAMEEPLSANEMALAFAERDLSFTGSDLPLVGSGLSFPERAAVAGELEAGRVGWGRALGTLVHYAIGQDWRPDDADTERTLLAQEVLFPFTDEQRARLVGEVIELLGAYWRLVGEALPALGARGVDRAELPLAVRYDETVWEGVLDRLYRVGDEWYLDDYKTDRQVVPERYYLQLAHYARAAERALGVRPRPRLVYLRSGRVVAPTPDVLEEAFAAAPLGGGLTGP